MIPAGRRILFVSLGSHGDIHPFVAMGRELVERGGAAAMLTNPHFGPLVAAAGLSLQSFGEAQSVRQVVSSHRDSMHALKGPMVVLRRMLGPMIAPMLETLRRAIRTFKPDAVVAHQLCIGSRWVCEQEGVPFATVALAPCGWMNPNDQLAMTPMRSHTPSRRAVRFDVWMGKWFTGFALDGMLNDVRRSMGLAPSRFHWYREIEAAALNLGLWSPHLRGPVAGDPPGASICGFPYFDADPAQQTDETELDAFLASGPPPVVFTLGTAVVHARPDFFPLAAHAAAMAGCRAVLVTGSRDYVPAALAGNIVTVPYARFSSLFGRAGVIVHHGGIGTMAQAMRAGKPTVIVPAAHDQFDNAARAVRLGVSQTVKLPNIRADRLAAAIREVAADAAVASRARTLAAALGPEHAASNALESIERLIAGTGRQSST